MAARARGLSRGAALHAHRRGRPAIGAFSDWPVAWSPPGEAAPAQPEPRRAPVELDFCAKHYASGETWDPLRFEGPRRAEAPVDAKHVEALLERLVQAAEGIAHYTGETSPHQWQSEYWSLAHDLWLLSTERGALQILRLQDNVIGEAGARALAESKTLASLRSLDVSSNPLCEAGVNAFAFGSGLPALRELSIGDNATTTDEERDFVDFDGTVVARGGAREPITALRACFAGKPHVKVS